MIGVTPKYPVLDVLSRDEVIKIHDATLEVLNDVGCKVQHEGALKHFSDAGAEVDEKAQLVKIPTWLVEEALHKAPHRVRLYSRKPGYDITCGIGKVYFVNSYGCPFVIDHETGKKRPVTLGDLENCAGVYEALDNIHAVMAEQIPQDVMMTAKNLELYITRALLCNTRKNVMIESYSAAGVRGMVRMAAAVMNCAVEDVAKQPVITGQLTASPPLLLHKVVADAMIELSKHGIPIAYWDLPQASASSPATLAGTLVIQNADILTGLVLSQIVNPGVPFIYGPYGSIMDQRYSTFVTGGPESGILSAASTSICRYYGLPVVAVGGGTESKVEDEQAGYEKAMTTLIAALAGPDIIHGVGGWLENLLSSSLSQAVIMDEILGEVNRYLQGIEINEETLAVDIIKKVGAHGNFIGEKHTKEYFLKEDFMPKLTDRRTRGDWESRGANVLPDAAKVRVKKILAEHKEVVEKDVKAKLDAILAEFETQEA
jgi:trimethylamine--corrinoid protein Co-methyltransferase